MKPALAGGDDPDVEHCIHELRAGFGVEENSRRIFARYYPWVRGFFRRLGYGGEDAEDLAQDCLLQVFDRLPTYRGEGSFNSWLFAIATNLHRNARRRLGSTKRHAPEEPLEAPDRPELGRVEIASHQDSPAKATYDRERHEALSRAIQGMPPRMAQVLALRLGQDLRFREIAAALRISVDTAKAHFHQARQRLREALGEDFGGWTE